jgi:hypothetical protein
MAGTLTISTLSDGTNSTSATNCISGSAKAWVNFNGTTGAIKASYNVSSVTVVTTGSYTVNMTSALTDTNYCVQVTNQQNSTTNYSSNITAPSTTTAINVYHFESGALAYPFTNSSMFVAVFR